MNIEEGNSLWSDAWIRLKKNRMAYVSLWIISIIILACFVIPIVGGLFAPDDRVERATNYWFKDPNVTSLSNKFQPASAQHILGTDQLGRDLFSRILFGGQISLIVGLVATVISMVIGIAYGAIAGYLGKKADAVMMRIVDLLYGLPFLVIVILLSVLISKWAEEKKASLIEWGWSDALINITVNILPLCIAIGILGWYTMARVVRSQVLSSKNLEYVEAARSLGLSHRNLLFKQILPNLLGPIIVYTTLTIPGFILTEATLSFLGLGVQAPNSSWGILLSEGANYLETQPSLLVLPSIIFALTLLALNFLGDGLRDALDPKASKD
jgi:oligopeptide transport system permease protein